MKKTIAILLVLVIAMAGVWAAETVEIYTVIDEVADFAISAYDAEDTTNLGKLVSLTGTWTTAEIDKEVTSAAANIGWLNVRTNSATGFTIDINAPSLTNEENTLAENINYVFALTGSSGIVSPGTYNTSSETGSKNMVTLEAVNSLTIYNYLMNVDLDDIEYAAAASGTYSTDITVTFTAT